MRPALVISSASVRASPLAAEQRGGDQCFGAGHARDDAVAEIAQSPFWQREPDPFALGIELGDDSLDFGHAAPFVRHGCDGPSPGKSDACFHSVSIANE